MHHVALATSSGSVLLYNLNSDKLSRPAVQLDSNRSVNSISFNTVAGNQLLLGSGDGVIRLWDIREGTRRPSLNFVKNGDSAREVQWKPFDARQFAVIYDSGIIQRWDARNPSAPDKRLNAHVGVGLTLQWHPELDYIASGGRDCQIQVWNMSNESRNPDHVLHSPISVGKVRWQLDPSKTSNILTTNIASCGRSKTDFGVYVWTLTRPYIPVHVVQEHSDMVTDVHYGKDKSLWSISADRTFVIHDITNEQLAIDALPSNAISWLPDNSLSFVVQDKHREQFMAGSSRVVFTMDDDSTVDEQNVRRQSTSVTVHTPPQSALTSEGAATMNSVKRFRYSSTVQAICNAAFPGQDPEVFEFLAEEYSIFPQEGQTLADLCNNNSQVAIRALRFRTSAAWSILAQPLLQEQVRFEKELSTLEKKLSHVAPQTGAVAVASGVVNPKPSSKITESLRGLPLTTSDLVKEECGLSPTDTRGLEVNFERPPSLAPLSISVPSQVSESTTVEPVQVPNSQVTKQCFEVEIDGYSFYGTGVSAEEMFEEDGSIVSRSNGPVNYTHISMLNRRGTSHSVSTGSMSESGETVDSLRRGLGNLKSGYVLDEIKEDEFSDASEPFSSHGGKFGGMSVNSRDVVIPTINKAPEVVNSPEKDHIPDGDFIDIVRMKQMYKEFRAAQDCPWTPENLLRKMVDYSLDQGDLQLATILMIIFSEEYPSALPSARVQEECIYMYIQLLRRAQIFESAAEIIKLSPFKSIRELAFSETSLDPLCHRCMKPLVENSTAKDREVPKSDIAFWYCDHCHKILTGCVMCNEPAKGLAIALLGCGHKVHVDCMKDWMFTEGMMECPSGCGNQFCGEI